MSRIQMFACSSFMSHLLPDHTVAGSIFQPDYAGEAHETTAFLAVFVTTSRRNAPGLALPDTRPRDGEATRRRNRPREQARNALPGQPNAGQARESHPR